LVVEDVGEGGWDAGARPAKIKMRTAHFFSRADHHHDDDHATTIVSTTTTLLNAAKIHAVSGYTRDDERLPPLLIAREKRKTIPPDMVLFLKNLT
jgi:hypothetical protein